MTTDNGRIRLGGWVNKRDRVKEKRCREKSESRRSPTICIAGMGLINCAGNPRKQPLMNASHDIGLS